MGKRLTVLFLAVLVFMLPSCSEKITANKVLSIVNSNYEIIIEASLEMAEFQKDRIYVAIENTAKDGEEECISLVWYEKESGDREKIENPVLQEVIEKTGIKIIFFQTAENGRQSVIFSYAKESENTGISRGFYYSFDSLPIAWWGRDTKLKKDHDRYILLDESNKAWYSTVNIKDSLFYFEKTGKITA